MNDVQFIKINEDSSIKVEYKRTQYIDIPNPDNLKGVDLIAYVTEKIIEAEARDDFIDPEEGILEELEILQTASGPVLIETPGAADLKKW
jgi:hypothetical protein